MAGSSPAMMTGGKGKGRTRVCKGILTHQLIMRGLDPRILFGGEEKDGRVKPGHDDWVEEGRTRVCKGILPQPIMRGLDPRILFGGGKKDGRDKPGHDDWGEGERADAGV